MFKLYVSAISEVSHGPETWPSEGVDESPFSENPNDPLPHIILRRFFRPSPNSSFHFLRAERLPKDSEDDGVISIRALLKWRENSVRRMTGSTDGKGSDPSGREASWIFSSTAVLSLIIAPLF